MASGLKDGLTLGLFDGLLLLDVLKLGDLLGDLLGDVLGDKLALGDFDGDELKLTTGPDCWSVSATASPATTSQADI